jgi:hypothetical protein
MGKVVSLTGAAVFATAIITLATSTTIAAPPSSQASARPPACIAWGSYGESHYLAGGKYFFKNPDGSRDYGKWTTHEDNSVTVNFDNGRSRTDSFQVDGVQVMDTANGASGSLCK